MVLPSSTPTCGGLAGSSRARSAAASSAPAWMWSRQLTNAVLGVDTAIGDVDERRQQLGDGRVAGRGRAPRARSPASGGRLGQLAADPQQLPGGAADRELRLLGGQEVAVHRVIDVDADAAVHVHGGVRDAVTGLGRPERRGAHLEVGGQILRQPPRRLRQRSAAGALMSM